MSETDLRELDGWIAEHVFDWQRVKRAKINGRVYEGEFFWRKVWGDPLDENFAGAYLTTIPERYSSDPAAFSLVKREVERRGWGWVSMRLPDVVDTPYHFHIITATKELGFGEAATEELAGCRAVSRTEGL